MPAQPRGARVREFQETARKFRGGGGGERSTEGAAPPQLARPLPPCGISPATHATAPAGCSNVLVALAIAASLRPGSNTWQGRVDEGPL